jgi:hypothetical protein
MTTKRWVAIGVAISLIVIAFVLYGERRIGAQMAPIAVMIGTEVHAPLTDDALRRNSPDRTIRGWRLWRLQPLLDGQPAPGSYVNLERSDGSRAGLSTPAATSGFDIVLALAPTGRSSLILSRLDGPSPLPPGLARTDATLTRVHVIPPLSVPSTAVNWGGGGRGQQRNAAPAAAATSSGSSAASPASIAPTVPKGQADMAAVEPPALKVVLADGGAASWTRAAMVRVPARSDIPTENGLVSAWSLRDVAATLVAPGARIATLTSSTGETLTLSREEWTDEARQPLLRVNHRGMWKFDWIDGATRRPLAHGMRDVVSVGLAP